MPIRIFVILVLFLSACQNEKQTEDVFAHLSKEERDSLSDQYQQTAYYMYQPTKAHRRYFDSALYANPYDVGKRQVYSYSYKKRGEHIKAMELLTEAVRQDIENESVESLQYRAWTLLYFYRDYKGTIEDVNLIESMTGFKYNVCWGEPCGFHKGQAQYKLGQFAEAIKTFETVNIEEAKQGFDISANHFIFFYIGRCYHEMKQYELALENYNKVLLADDSFSEALYQIGMVHLQIGNKPKAEEYLNQALYWIQKGKKMEEPYIERFDELFEYMVVDAMEKLRVY